MSTKALQILILKLQANFGGWANAQIQTLVKGKIECIQSSWSSWSSAASSLFMSVTYTECRLLEGLSRVLITPFHQPSSPPVPGPLPLAQWPTVLRRSFSKCLFCQRSREQDSGVRSMGPAKSQCVFQFSFSVACQPCSARWQEISLGTIKQRLWHFVAVLWKLAMLYSNQQTWGKGSDLQVYEQPHASADGSLSNFGLFIYLFISFLLWPFSNIQK